MKTKVTESDKNQASRFKFINLVRLKWHSGTMEFSPRLAMVVAQGRAPHTSYFCSSLSYFCSAFSYFPHVSDIFSLLSHIFSLTFNSNICCYQDEFLSEPWHKISQNNICYMYLHTTSAFLYSHNRQNQRMRNRRQNFCVSFFNQDASISLARGKMKKKVFWA